MSVTCEEKKFCRQTIDEGWKEVSESVEALSPFAVVALSLSFAMSRNHGTEGEVLKTAANRPNVARLIVQLADLALAEVMTRDIEQKSPTENS